MNENNTIYNKLPHESLDQIKTIFSDMMKNIDESKSEQIKL